MEFHPGKIQKQIQERFTNLNLSQFTNVDKPWSQAPLLKGKAAEIRRLIPVLASVAWDKANATGGLKESHIAECLRSLACFYDQIYQADFFMTQEEAVAAFGHIKKCLRHYAWLQIEGASDILFQSFIGLTIWGICASGKTHKVSGLTSKRAGWEAWQQWLTVVPMAQKPQSCQSAFVKNIFSVCN